MLWVLSLSALHTYSSSVLLMSVFEQEKEPPGGKWGKGSNKITVAVHALWGEFCMRSSGPELTFPSKHLHGSFENLCFPFAKNSRGANAFLVGLVSLLDTQRTPRSYTSCFSSKGNTVSVLWRKKFNIRRILDQTFRNKPQIISASSHHQDSWYSRGHFCRCGRIKNVLSLLNKAAVWEHRELGCGNHSPGLWINEVNAVF